MHWRLGNHAVGWRDSNKSTQYGLANNINKILKGNYLLDVYTPGCLLASTGIANEFPKYFREITYQEAQEEKVIMIRRGFS